MYMYMMYITCNCFDVPRQVMDYSMQYCVQHLKESNDKDFCNSNFRDMW